MSKVVESIPTVYGYIVSDGTRSFATTSENREAVVEALVDEQPTQYIKAFLLKE